MPSPPQEALLEQLRGAAIAAAGMPNDFRHRAQRYLDLYRQSGGNHDFALLAAHGAVWAQRYLRAALRCGGVAAALRSPDRQRRHALWRRMTGFADAFRLLHQRVFAETELTWRISGDPALRDLAAHDLDPVALSLLERCHAAARLGRRMGAAERRRLFDAMFRWEQHHVVADAVDAAFAAIDWPLVSAVARRPIVRFGYFGVGTALHFHDFRNREERVWQGARAWDLAERAGWSQVRATLEAALHDPRARPRPERDCPLAGWLGAAPAHG